LQVLHEFRLMNRREFIALSVCLAAGCAESAPPTALAPGTALDFGPAADYAAEGVYDRYRDRGFFIIHRGGRFWALSSICTHKTCKLDKTPADSFTCNCHGSTFDPDGHVQKGPARRDLPSYAMSVDERGRLILRA
jgi:nitrite reductase/ring-hydroxylating ferredoxin subunit